MEEDKEKPDDSTNYYGSIEFSFAEFIKRTQAFSSIE